MSERIVRVRHFHDKKIGEAVEMEYTRNSIRDVVTVIRRQCHKTYDDKEVRYSEYSLTSSEVVTIHFYKGG